MVAVLFARHDSIYKTLPDCDVWDFERDARNWPGGCPVIAHPPCRAWGQMSHFAAPGNGERELAIWAVEQVRKWGGVLEHPAQSKLWPKLNLPTPGQRDEFGGYTVWISQWWFGHRADKPTHLYIVGCEPSNLPEIPFKLGEASHVISSTVRKGQAGWKPHVTKAEREHTPLDLALWLRDVALRVASTGAGRAENNRRRSPVSTPGASLKAAPPPYAAEGGGSFAAPTGHALSAARLAEHRHGTGARICQVAVQQGIELQLVRHWPNEGRKFERRLKNSGSLARVCPLCRQATLDRMKTYNKKRVR